MNSSGQIDMSSVLSRKEGKRNVKIDLVIFVTSTFLVGILLIGLSTNVVTQQLHVENWTFELVIRPEIRPTSTYLPSGTPHDPIIINGDANFNDTADVENWAGNGSYVNPYVIEGLNVNLIGTSDICINIRNTRVHFIIRDCYVNGTYGEYTFGFYLVNITNALIINNTCTNNYASINLRNSTGNTISNNNCSSNTNMGIRLQEVSTFNVIEHNTCNENAGYGIYMERSHSNIVRSNNCTANGGYGIRIREEDWISTHNNLTGNICSHNFNDGMHISSRFGLIVVANNICTHNGGTGIYLSSVTSVVTNNTCTNNEYYGFILGSGSDHIVANNTCDGNINGITLASGSNHIVTNNTCTNNSQYGVYLYAISNSFAANNTCLSNSNGIYLEDSSSNTVVNNTCNDNNNGIHLYQSASNTVVNNTCNDNNNGIHLYGGSGYNTIANNTCFENEVGILFESSSWNTVTNNTCNDGDYGFSLFGNSNINTLVNNTCNYNNYHGIYLYVSHDNMIVNNTCISNNDRGIYLELSGNNFVLWNTFENNGANAFNGHSTNTFDYNYWSDYVGYDADGDGFGDTPYPVRGVAGVVDPHPQIKWWVPPSWDEPIVDVYLEFGQDFRLDLNASAPTPLTWWLNDTMHFAMDQHGVITNLVNLQVGMYGLEVRVGNAYGLYCTGNFTLHVADTSMPEWVEEPVNQILEYGDTLYYALSATDQSPLSQWWVDDTAQFTITSDGFISSVVALPVGSYVLNVFVNDSSGNILTTALSVIVQDTTIPTWISLPLDQRVEYGMRIDVYCDAWDLSGISHWTINDTVNFAITGQGWIFNLNTLPAGQYDLAIAVYDHHGNHATSTFTVTIEVPDPPTWTLAPADATYELGDSIEFEVEAIDFTGIDRWWLDDNRYFEVNQEGTLSNTTFVPVGEHALTLWVSDPLDNSQSATFTITVVDTTAPIWTELPKGRSLSAGEAFYLRLFAWDLSGITHWVLEGDASFAITNQGRITSVVPLDSGTYSFNVTVSDPFGNSQSASIVVIVLAPAIGMQSPTLTVLAIIGGIGGGAVILVLGYQFMSRRRAGSSVSTSALGKKSKWTLIGTMWKEVFYVK